MEHSATGTREERAVTQSLVTPAITEDGWQQFLKSSIGIVKKCEKMFIAISHDTCNFMLGWPI